MEFILVCLVVGALVVFLGALIFYAALIAISKILDFLDAGCGCLSLIILGFIVLVILVSIFS